jgi:DNA-directed RNA polymerase specialized sigma24 family protein
VRDQAGCDAWFDALVREVEPRLRHALVAVYGQERGRDATAEALAYAWEHREKVMWMANPAGYLYRVGRSRGRNRRLTPRFVPIEPARLPDIEPGLPGALDCLSERQRLTVVLVHAYSYDRQEVASILDISVSAVDTHLARGLVKLREKLGVQTDA